MDSVEELGRARMAKWSHQHLKEEQATKWFIAISTRMRCHISDDDEEVTHGTPRGPKRQQNGDFIIDADGVLEVFSCSD